MYWLEMKFVGVSLFEINNNSLKYKQLFVFLDVANE